MNLITFAHINSVVVKKIPIDNDKLTTIIKYFVFLQEQFTLRVWAVWSLSWESERIEKKTEKIESKSGVGVRSQSRMGFNPGFGVGSRSKKKLGSRNRSRDLESKKLEHRSQESESKNFERQGRSRVSESSKIYHCAPLGQTVPYRDVDKGGTRGVTAPPPPWGQFLR